MRISVITSLVLLGTVTFAADQSPSEKAIAKAIAGLEADRDKMTDAIEQSKIDKAIRELEGLVESDREPELPSAAADKILAALKKKFAGKVVWKEKTGELILAYDFIGKPQLADFDVGSKRVILQRRILALEAGDELKHNARFKSVQVSVVMGFKAMNGSGLASTNGATFTTGGPGQDAITLIEPGGGNTWKVVGDRIRRGNIPVWFKVTPEKVSVQYVKDVLTAPMNRPGDVHQVILRGGNEGCAFSNLVISGVPDPAWLNEITEGE